MPSAKRNTWYRNKRHFANESTDNQVRNLSAVNLSHVQLRVLNKGLQFVPTSFLKTEELCMKTEQTRLDRQIRLNFQFDNGNNEGTVKDDTIFHVPSNYMPPKITSHPEVESYLTQFRSEWAGLIDLLIDGEKKRHIMHKRNLSPDEQKALIKLKTMTNLVIKPADKGGALVVMDREHYLNGGLRQLRDVQYYRPLPRTIQSETKEQVTQLVQELLTGKHINQKIYRYLLPPDEPKLREFYGLPKVHKNEESWPVPGKEPPLRPVCPNVGTALTNLSQWVDFHIQPLAKRMLSESLVKDSYDFVSRLKQLVIPADTPITLLAVDVESLYTNIPHKEGIDAIRESYERGIGTRPLTHLLCRALNLILTKNDMVFNGKHYLQVKGVAMGTNAAPAIANIFMERVDMCVRRCNPIGYWRFIDDLFIVWDNRRDLQVLKDSINTCDPNLRFTYAESALSNTFLDLEIMVTDRVQAEGKLDYKVYFKPTDTHQLLHRESSHPRHTFDGIIKSQMFRYKRLSSRTADFENSCRVLFKVLQTRGYQRDNLLKIKHQVEGMNVELQRQAVVQKVPSLYLIMQYDVRLQRIPQQVRESWKTFWNANPNIQRFVPDKLTISWKRGKNIREALVRAALPTIGPTTWRERANEISRTVRSQVSTALNKGVSNATV